VDFNSALASTVSDLPAGLAELRRRLNRSSDRFETNRSSTRCSADRQETGDERSADDDRPRHDPPLGRRPRWPAGDGQAHGRKG
jgi:hypothetical protein